MNAETLIGTVLGTCTLQKLIGQGGMGAVFLAQQSRPHRQVAVKVLFPITPLTPGQRAAFLERFRRETDVVASLEHPNIMPVHEYGERDGLAYLVMPYINGGTLRDEMERGGPMPLAKTVLYLEQMAAALEIAHDHGVIHRDIKPANILVRREGRLLLTDFGLVKIISEGQNAKARLTGVGAPLGTPDYMAPEQVMSGEIDTRADMYALGVILYQMVTGTVPFKANMPMQVAMQHIQTPPPLPRTFRPELPPASEQVMLRVLAKRPDDRYKNVQEFASAFHQSLIISGVQLPDFSGLHALDGNTDVRIFTPHIPLPPAVNAQPEVMQAAENALPTFDRFVLGRKLNLRRPSESENQVVMPSSPEVEIQPFQNVQLPHPNFSAFAMPLEGSSLRPSTMSLWEQEPSSSEKSGLRPSPTRFLGRSILRPMGPSTLAGSGVPPLPEEHPLSSPPAENVGTQLFPSLDINRAAESVAPLPPTNKQTNPGSGMSQFNPSSVFPSATDLSTGSMIQPLDGSPIPTFRGSTAQLSGNPGTQQLSAPPARQKTGALVMGNVGMSNAGIGTGNNGMIKLEQAAKIVQVPVAGQPGRYVTGLLPVLEEQKTSLPLPIAKKVAAIDVLLKGRLKLVVLIAAVVLVVFSSIAFFLVQAHNNTAANESKNAMGVVATATANAIKTGASNVVVKDPLDGNGGNIHNLLLGNSSGSLYIFKNNTYHITVNSKNAAIALLPNISMPGSFAYTLTMEAIKGDETGASGINSFGMIFCFGQQTKKNATATTFYTFEAINTKNSEYQFWKYDSSQGAGNEWTRIWQANFGKEYHQGHGPQGANTFNVLMKNSAFTFVVNGKVVKRLQDKSFQSGRVGMIVNLQGTEVAFSNLLLTNN